MRDFNLSHLSNAHLLQNLSALLVRDREMTADLLAHLAEVDARRLYDEEGYSSMFTYCVRALHMSESEAWKRIYGARAARKFPALLGALDQGRIHLTALCLLAPHVTQENVDTLINAAVHKGRTEIEAWLVANSITLAVPMPPCSIKPILMGTVQPDLEKNEMGMFAPNESVSAENGEHSPMQAEVSSGMSLQHVLGQVEVSPGIAPKPEDPSTQTASPTAPSPDGVPSPFATPSPPTGPALPEHYRMQVTIARRTHDKLRQAQALLGHAVPSGDVAEVLDRALDLLVAHLERRKFGGARGPRRARFPRRESPNARYVPMQVRRAVWERDEGQCTFVGAGGQRCGERTRLEYDHARPVAHGGTPTLANVRLRCRAHNQTEARRAFGSEFMRRKREGER